MFKCLYKRFRHKKGIMYTYCTKKRSEVLKTCENECLEKEYKKVKPIKKVSKKKITVSRETYEIVFERDKGRCRLCNSYENLHLHHIESRNTHKELIDEPSNCIMLCQNCHLNIVHKNNKKYRPILKEMIK